VSTVNYTVNAIDSASATFARIAGSADELLATLDDLSHKTAIARVGVDGDKEAELRIDKVDLKMANLARRVAEGKIGVEGQAKAITDIRRLVLELDKFGAKHVTATVDVNVNRQSLLGRLRSGGLEGSLGRLFGGGGGAGGAAGAAGGAAGGAAQAGGGLFGGLPPELKATGIAAAITGALALGPSVIGLGLGGGAGLGAIGGGLFGAAQGNKILKADTANITQITTALKTAIGKQKDQLSAALKDANKQYAKDSAFYAPFIAFQKTLADLAQTILKPLRPVLAPLSGLFQDFGKGLAKLGPVLTQVLDASIPFVHTFLDVLLQAGKNLLPAFSYALNQMVSSGALQLMTQGLVILTKGLADFIVALGPGMKSSALIFRDMTVIIAGALKGIGIAASFVANVLEDYFHRAKVNLVKMAAQWDDFRHRTAVVFDGIRHDIAHIWDMIWNNTVGRLQRGVSDSDGLIKGFGHWIASTFDTIRHDIATAWDTIWRNTVTRVQNGISDVVTWFKGLPGKAVGALFGLGHSLAAFARSAISEMWTGFKNTFSTVIHWFEGLPKMILHALGVNSPPDWAVSAGKWIMKGLHIGLGHGLGQLTSFTTSIGDRVAAGLMGAFGGAMGDSGARTRSAAVAQRYAASILSQYGWSQSQMAALVPLWNAESGWSAYAVNKSSGAYGIPQSLGHGHPYALGDYVNQIIWGLNYIRGRYGSPAAAWAHEQSFGWYGGGLAGGIFSRPTLIGVGERGPERVDITPADQGRRGGDVVFQPGSIVIQAPAGNGTQIGQQLVAYLNEALRRGAKLHAGSF
jgi:hypothetical protein